VTWRLFRDKRCVCAERNHRLSLLRLARSVEARDAREVIWLDEQIKLEELRSHAKLMQRSLGGFPELQKTHDDIQTVRVRPTTLNSDRSSHACNRRKTIDHRVDGDFDGEIIVKSLICAARTMMIRNTW
jgi:hypothetical protein